MAVARNSDGLFDVLQKISRTSKVEFGVLPSEATHDFSTNLSPKDPNTSVVKLNQRTIDAAEHDLPKMAAMVQVALLIKDDLPADLALKLSGGQMVSADQPHTLGLLPPGLMLRNDDPFLQLQENAHQLLGLASTIDTVYKNKESGYAVKIGDLYELFTHKSVDVANSWFGTWNRYIQPRAANEVPAPAQPQAPE